MIKQICLPILSEELCELLGAVLGDGTLTKHFIRISGDYRYDLEYFAYLNFLVNSLFGINGVVEKDKRGNIAYLRFCSILFCKFFNELGLPYGKKIDIHLPTTLLANKQFKIGLLRGLMDTDGSLCKRGNRLALVYTSYNKYLLNLVETIGKEFDVFTHKNESQVGTDSWPKICKYFGLIGSSNFRHITCFLAKIKHNKLIYKIETEKFKNLREGLIVPYRALGLVVRA